jgi:hypothetical protein
LDIETGKHLDSRLQITKNRLGAHGDDLFFVPLDRENVQPATREPSEIPVGMPLAEYAMAQGIHIAEVWRLIRSGELIARPINGILFVFSEHSATAIDFRKGAFSALETREVQPDSAREEVASVVMRAVGNLSEEMLDEDAGELPSLPPEATERNLGGSIGNTGGAMRVLSSFPEMALLLDHLSLAKEENKEIIRLTQDTIQRVTAMSENIVAMKNEIIDAKDAQIDILKERLGEQSSRIQTLNQEMEDLEMLARSIAMD